MVSTPTATAKELRMHFDEARQSVRHFETQLPALFREVLSDVRNVLGTDSEILLAHLHSFRELVVTLRQDLMERLFLIQSAIERKIESLRQGRKSLNNGFSALFKRVEEHIKHSSERLEQYDPVCVLRLGYSLIRKGTQVIKNSGDVKIGDILSLQLSKGKVNAKVEEIFE